LVAAAALVVVTKWCLICKKWCDASHLASQAHSNKCDNHEAEQNTLEMLDMPGLALLGPVIQDDTLRGELREQVHEIHDMVRIGGHRARLSQLCHPSPAAPAAPSAAPAEDKAEAAKAEAAGAGLNSDEEAASAPAAPSAPAEDKAEAAGAGEQNEENKAAAAGA
jgi:hypothetical protein